MLINFGFVSCIFLHQMDYKNAVYGFRTLHKDGFLQNEIDSLLMNYPLINFEKFNDALFGATCVEKDGEMVFYHIDVLHALRCGVEQRDLSNFEWD